MEEDTEECGPTAQDAWRLLTRVFSSWKFIPFHPNNIRISVLRFGNNFISQSRELTYWKRAEKIVADVTNHDLQRLKVWAEINRRQSENFFRVMLVMYITIPITAALVLGQLYPAEWASLDINLEELILMFAVYTFVLMVFFAGHWKAREMDDFLQLALAERGVFTSGGEQAGELNLPEG